MRAFSCDVCEQQLFFENSVCIRCGSNLGYARDQHKIVTLTADGRHTAPDGSVGVVCTNLNLNGCTWLAPMDAELGQCFACQLTRTRPADADAEGMREYYTAEAAKRRLVVELDELGLPITTRTEDPEAGLCFDLLSSVDESVTTGHADGVITVDLAESDDVHREHVRVMLAEPYRTMLGHFRHEIGHFYWSVLVDGTPALEPFRQLFGDDRAGYAAAIDRHYNEGPPANWTEDFVSTYATMHPWEDFAETFAHVLHVRDGLQTAAAHGLTVVVDPTAMRFADLLNGVWLPLTYALNQMNRSMGKEDLYPFVLPPPVVSKMQFVADLITAARGPYPMSI